MARIILRKNSGEILLKELNQRLQALERSSRISSIHYTRNRKQILKLFERLGKRNENGLLTFQSPVVRERWQQYQHVVDEHTVRLIDKYLQKPVKPLKVKPYRPRSR